MAIKLENLFFMGYDGSVRIDTDALIVAAWNTQVEGENKIFLNDKEFFEDEFENAYDAAWAVSMGGKWRHTDRFVYFEEGFLTSFTRLDDETCPIDRIDIGSLIKDLEDMIKGIETEGNENNNIPRAIHDALQGV